jgi:hypothetical protein
MKTFIASQGTCLLVVILGLLGSSHSWAADEMAIPPGNYSKQMGTAVLADPSGVTHSKADVANKVVVAIFTIPNMSHGSTQEKWAKVLANDSATKVSDRVFLVLVEDMSQAGWTKGMARDSMKKEFTSGSRPFLILDENGDVIKRFGVPANTTRILIYDKRGRLRDVEIDLKDVATTDRRIKKFTQQLMEE